MKRILALLLCLSVLGVATKSDARWYRDGYYGPYYGYGYYDPYYGPDYYDGGVVADVGEGVGAAAAGVGEGVGNVLGGIFGR